MPPMKKPAAMLSALVLATPGLFIATSVATSVPASAACSYVSSVAVRYYENHLNGRREYYYDATVRNPCISSRGGERVRVYGYRFGFLKVRSLCVFVPDRSTMPMTGLYEAYPQGVESC